MFCCCYIPAQIIHYKFRGYNRHYKCYNVLAKYKKISTNHSAGTITTFSRDDFSYSRTVKTGMRRMRYSKKSLYRSIARYALLMSGDF